MRDSIRPFTFMVFLLIGLASSVPLHTATSGDSTAVEKAYLQARQGSPSRPRRSHMNLAGVNNGETDFDHQENGVYNNENLAFQVEWARDGAYAPPVYEDVLGQMVNAARVGRVQGERVTARRWWQTRPEGRDIGQERPTLIVEPRLGYGVPWPALRYIEFRIGAGLLPFGYEGNWEILIWHQQQTVARVILRMQRPITEPVCPVPNNNGNRQCDNIDDPQPNLPQLPTQGTAGRVGGWIFGCFGGSGVFFVTVFLR